MIIVSFFELVDVEERLTTLSFCSPPKRSSWASTRSSPESLVDIFRRFVQFCSFVRNVIECRRDIRILSGRETYSRNEVGKRVLIRESHVVDGEFVLELVRSPVMVLY